MPADARRKQNVRRERAQMRGEGDDENIASETVPHIDGHYECGPGRVRVGGLAGQSDKPDLTALGEGPTCGGHCHNWSALRAAMEIQAASSRRSASDRVR